MSGSSINPLQNDSSVPHQPVLCGNVTCENGGCALVSGKDVCECKLGYTGLTCSETINETLPMPLTVGVLVVLLVIAFMLFALAVFRQKQKAKRRKKPEEEVLRSDAHL